MVSAADELHDVLGSHSSACIGLAAEAIHSSLAWDARPAAETRQLQHICTASLSRGGTM